jgi:hypothetical protein
MDAADPTRAERGPSLLVRHCAAIAEPEDASPPAGTRLERRIGRVFARFLVGALSRRRRERD